MATSSARSDAAVVVASSAVLVAGALPQMISGPLAPYVRLDLGISSAQLGLGLSLSAVPAVVLSVLGGRVTDRIGGITIGGITCLGSCMFMVALSRSPSIAWFVAIVAASGILRVLAEPSSSRILVDLLARTPRIFAFGMREAAVPLLVVVAAGLLPVFGDWLGWRSVFAATSIVGVVGLWLLVPPKRRRERPAAIDVAQYSGALVTVQPGPSTSPMVASLGSSFYAGAVLLFFNSVVLNTFAALSFADSGASEDAAAALMAASAGGTVLVRIGCTYAVARRGLSTRSTIATMAAAATVGYMTMAVGDTQLMIVGIPIAYLAGWGWPPLVYGYITMGREQSTGRITGVISAMYAITALAGPVATGWAAEQFGWLFVWATAALFSLLAAALMADGPRADRAAPSSPSLASGHGG